MREKVTITVLIVVCLVLAIASVADARVVCGVHCSTEDKQTAKEHEHGRPDLRASHDATHHYGGGTEQAIPSPWAALAECESHGEWDYGPHSGWGSGIHHGGLQFLPETWTAFSDPEDPEFAYQASVRRQIEIAERVLEAQGWEAWPACSRELGLR